MYLYMNVFNIIDFMSRLTTITIGEDLQKELKEYNKKHGTTTSGLFRVALRKLLDE